jgi:hypothetical protein
LDVGGLIDECNVGPLQVERRLPPVQNSFGGFDRQAPTVFQLNPVAAHTLNGRDLLQVPEADRNGEVTRFQAKERLFVADGGQAADVITYRGRRWRIVRVDDYLLQGGVFIADGALEDLQTP